MIEPIDPELVVTIDRLQHGDLVRVTLTQHGIYGVPIAEPANQLTGIVNKITPTTSIPRTFEAHLELPGEVLTHRIGAHWTFELLRPAPAKAAAQ
jgi:hypothetical protein